MANNSEKKEEAIDITKIYETIRGKAFIQDLWIDVMSDLKQKSSYMHLKSMVQKVVEASVDNYPIKPKDHVEKLKTRTTFTDLGIMGYTIDTIISDVVKKKLKNELMTMISGVVDDYSHTSNTENKTKSVIMLEDIGKLLCNGKNGDENEKTLGKIDSPGHSRRSIEKVSSNKHADKKRSKHKTKEKGTSELRNGSLPMSYSNKVGSKSGSPSKKLDYKGKKFSVTCNDENAEVDVIKVSDDEDDMQSIRSVSSVHTSDLSSFEDDISISSEDENGVKVKKRVSLQLAQDLYSSGRLSELHKIQRPEEQVSSGSSEKHSAVGSLNQRSSTRTRKVNSKYVSDDVVCPMKLSSLQSDVSDREEILSIHNSQTPSPSTAAKKQEKYSKPLKTFKRNISRDDESSSDSDSSAPSLSSSNEIQSAAKKGRPRKDKSQVDQSSSAAKQTSHRKRGRPSKSSCEKPEGSKKQCVLDNMLPNLEKKIEPQNVTHQAELSVSELSDKNSDSEINRKRKKQSKKKQENKEESDQDLIESFSRLEESLCVRNETQSSPSKSTKSYDTSDLYKPRSDFRIFNNSKGNRALTLFSN